MTREEFLDKMMDILDTEDEVNMDSLLADIEEWDSLSLVSFMAMVNVVCGKKLSPQTVRKAKKISDLYALILE